MDTAAHRGSKSHSLACLCEAAKMQATEREEDENSGNGSTDLRSVVSGTLHTDRPQYFL